MSIADELHKLEELRKSGVLSEQEFAQAKASLLQGSAKPAATPHDDHLAEIKQQNELAQIDREWEIERERYLVLDRFGRAHVPQSGGAEAIGIANNIFRGAQVGAVIFGIAWTVFAFYLTQDAPWPIVRIIFPLFGVLFVVGGIAGGSRMAKLMALKKREYEEKAARYEEGYAAFQQRRAEVVRRHARST